MKTLIVLASVALAVSALTDKEQWKEFKNFHGREYHPKEEQARYRIFQDNLRLIEEHNEKYRRGEKTYYLGVTQFADMTRNEFLSMLNYSKTTMPSKLFNVTNLDEVPEASVPSSIDWRTKGVVTEVKNQGNCGSCWAFSATGAMEGAYAIKTGNIVDLSEQNLIDCSYNYGNQGCNGGAMPYAFHYVRDYGIETEDDYPYEGMMMSCQFQSRRSVFKVSGYRSLAYGEDVLQKAVGTIGPISVAVNAEDFQHYSGGIFNEMGCDSNLNHGVLAVGYGTTASTPFWIVKNSWGRSWGENGYIRMIRNNDQCGIGDDASYPII